MESTITHLATANELCEAKASGILRWLAESEDPSKATFTVSRVIDPGVLPENTKAFFRLLLEERFSGKDFELELNPEELRLLLTEAFTNTNRYLLIPQSFITDFLSFGTDSVSINVKMLARLNALADYPYFPEMLEEWFASTSQNSVPEERKANLRKFLADVERTIIKYSSPAEIAGYLKPLFEFYDTELFDRSVIELLVSDKGLVFPETSEKVQYNVEEVSDLLKELYRASEEATPDEELPTIPEYNTFLKELREIGVVLPPPHVPHSNGEQSPLPPLEMFIGPKLRKKCLEKIFRENKNEYDRAIKTLNASQDYTQAELNLNTLLHIHKISPESKVATKLKEALRSRFGITLSV